MENTVFEENPFNGIAEIPQVKEFYLLRLDDWEWTRTDGASGEAFYDHSQDGLLFSSSSECPLCEGTVVVGAGSSGKENYQARFFCCLSCGISGDIVGSFGEKGVASRDPLDDEYVPLPECIVISILV